jgi:hypothetical protein
MRRNNKKRLLSLLLVFLFSFVVSAAYAAGNGALIFQNASTAISASTMVRLETSPNNSIAGTNATATIGAVTNSGDDSLAAITATLNAPGATVTIPFSMVNTGNTPARLSDAVVETATGGGTGLPAEGINIVVHGNIPTTSIWGPIGAQNYEATGNPADNGILDVGNPTAGRIVITWDAAFPDVEIATYHFDIRIPWIFGTFA